MDGLTTVLLSLNFYHKNTQNFDQKANLQQNRIHLEQKIMPALLVMLETFRRFQRAESRNIDFIT